MDPQISSLIEEEVFDLQTEKEDNSEDELISFPRHALGQPSVIYEPQKEMLDLSIELKKLMSKGFEAVTVKQWVEHLRNVLQAQHFQPQDVRNWFDYVKPHLQSWWITPRTSEAFFTTFITLMKNILAYNIKSQPRGTTSTVEFETLDDSQSTTVNADFLKYYFWDKDNPFFLELCEQNHHQSAIDFINFFIIDLKMPRLDLLLLPVLLDHESWSLQARVFYLILYDYEAILERKEFVDRYNNLSSDHQAKIKLHVLSLVLPEPHLYINRLDKRFIKAIFSEDDDFAILEPWFSLAFTTPQVDLLEYGSEVCAKTRRFEKAIQKINLDAAGFHHLSNEMKELLNKTQLSGLIPAPLMKKSGDTLEYFYVSRDIALRSLIAIFSQFVLSDDDIMKWFEKMLSNHINKGVLYEWVASQHVVIEILLKCLELDRDSPLRTRIFTRYMKWMFPEDGSCKLSDLCLPYYPDKSLINREQTRIRHLTPSKFISKHFQLITTLINENIIHAPEDLLNRFLQAPYLNLTLMQRLTRYKKLPLHQQIFNLLLNQLQRAEVPVQLYFFTSMNNFEKKSTFYLNFLYNTAGLKKLYKQYRPIAIHLLKQLIHLFLTDPKTDPHNISKFLNFLDYPIRSELLHAMNRDEKNALINYFQNDAHNFSDIAALLFTPKLNSTHELPVKAFMSRDIDPQARESLFKKLMLSTNLTFEHLKEIKPYLNDADDKRCLTFLIQLRKLEQPLFWSKRIEKLPTISSNFMRESQNNNQFNTIFDTLIDYLIQLDLNSPTVKSYCLELCFLSLCYHTLNQKNPDLVNDFKQKTSHFLNKDEEPSLIVRRNVERDQINPFFKILSQVANEPNEELSKDERKKISTLVQIAKI